MAPTAFWAVVLLLTSASAAIPGEGDLVDTWSPPGDLLDPFDEELPYPPEEVDLFHRHHNHEGLPYLETESRDSVSSSQGPPAVLSDPCDGYTHRSPILIDGNSDLSAAGNGVVNPDAAGTPEDPFVIEGWCITNHTWGQTFEAILVKETNLHLVIRDNMIAPTGVGNGIVLENVAHAIVRENELVGNSQGVRLVSSNGNTITDNLIRDSLADFFARGVELDSSHNNVVIGNTITRIDRDGVRMLSSHGNLLQGNVISDNGYALTNSGIRVFTSDNNVFEDNLLMNNTGSGLSLSQSTNATITQNEFHGDGLYLYLTQFTMQRSFWDHQVDQTNTVNGKPIMFLRDAENITIDQEVGQLFLLDTSHVTIEGQQILDVAAGVVAGYSNNITIRNTTFDVNLDAIEFYQSDDNIIQDNTLLRYGHHGIHLVFSHRNLVENNILEVKSSGGGHASLELEASIDNTLRNNTVSESSTWCLYLATNSRNTLVEGNSVSNCEREGIIVRESHDNQILDNIVQDVDGSGIEVSISARNNIVRGNSVSNVGSRGLFMWSVVNTTIENNSIHNVPTGMWMLDNFEGSIRDNSFTENSFSGISLSRNIDVVVQGNNIDTGGQYGLRINWNDPGGFVFKTDMTNNWWGHPTGPNSPSGSDPTDLPAFDVCTPQLANGEGAAIQARLSSICFTPWLTEPNPEAGSG